MWEQRNLNAYQPENFSSISCASTTPLHHHASHIDIAVSNWAKRWWRGAIRIAILVSLICWSRATSKIMSNSTYWQTGNPLFGSYVVESGTPRHRPTEDTHSFRSSDLLWKRSSLPQLRCAYTRFSTHCRSCGSRSSPPSGTTTIVAYRYHHHA
jgi:hypothetical protein